MIQRTYRIRTPDDAGKMLQEIEESEAYRKASDAALFVAAGNTARHLILGYLRLFKIRLPDLKVFGMVQPGTRQEGVDIETRDDDLICSFLAFESGGVEIRMAACSGEVTETAAEESENAASKCAGDLRAEIEIHARYGRKPDREIDNNMSKNNAKKIVLFSEEVFEGTDLCDNAVLEIAFEGEDLHAEKVCSNSWEPVGIPHRITGMRGAYTVETIDGQPAADLYRKYLGIDSDPYFRENARAFPLLEGDGREAVMHIPERCFPDGSVRFSSEMVEGTELRFACVRPDRLRKDVLEMVSEIEDFEPQAMLLFELSIQKEADAAFQKRQILCGNSSDCLISRNGNRILSPGECSLAVIELREGRPSGHRTLVIVDTAAEKESIIPLDRRVGRLLEQTARDMEQLAAADQLTGIANRRKLDEQMELLLKKQVNGKPFSAMMFDIDHFKRINDTCGHLAGDSVLRELCRLVGKEIRAADLLGRWGGEEFICLFDRIPEEKAVQIAERIRMRVEEHDFIGVGHITISAGVTTALLSDTRDSLMARLDQALYQAKRQGRNAIVTIP